jgi:hypothetical protein
VSKFFFTLEILSCRNLANYSSIKRHFMGFLALLSVDVNPISIFIHASEEIFHPRNDGRRGKRAETASGDCCTELGGETFSACSGAR